MRYKLSIFVLSLCIMKAISAMETSNHKMQNDTGNTHAAENGETKSDNKSDSFSQSPSYYDSPCGHGRSAFGCCQYDESTSQQTLDNPNWY